MRRACRATVRARSWSLLPTPGSRSSSYITAAMVDADLLSDPFGERQRLQVLAPMALLGARIRFESNDRRLLELARAAFGGLPPHRLKPDAQELRIVLQLTRKPRSRRRSEPPHTTMLSGAGLLAGAPESASFVAM